MNSYPTNRRRRSKVTKSAVTNPKRPIGQRRAYPPEIFVKCVDREKPWRDPYARAHLRNKHGYVYLTWRDGQRVRTFYLGKAPRKSPTAPARAPDQAAAAPASCRISL